MNNEPVFNSLEAFLASVPAISRPFGHGYESDGQWWVKFDFDIEDPLAWHVVHELGHVLNYLCVSERLPTTFKPVSPPPYMNGGPSEFLSWVIECFDKDTQPATVAECLEVHLPQPVNDRDQWNLDQ